MRTGTLVSCVMLVEMPGHDDVVNEMIPDTQPYFYVGIVSTISYTNTSTIINPIKKLSLYHLLLSISVSLGASASRAPHRYLYPGDVDRTVTYFSCAPLAGAIEWFARNLQIFGRLRVCEGRVESGRITLNHPYPYPPPIPQHH